MDKMVTIVAKLSLEMGLMEDAAKEQFNFDDLTLTQMHYLETINILVNPNITEIAATLKLKKPTVTVAVDKLIEKDYLYKVQSDEDRRSTHLHLTEKGKLINQMHDYAHKRIAESMIKKMDENDIKTFIQLFDKIFSI